MPNDTELTRLETTFLPESNEHRVRLYGPNGELISEQIMAVDLSRDAAPPLYFEQATSSNAYTASGRNLDIDMREWDREQDAHHSIYRREYTSMFERDYSRPEREFIRDAERYLRDVEWPRRVRAERRACIFSDGEWIGGCDYAEQPDIKDERGGALDEFLDEFKPQTTPERSDK